MIMKKLLIFALSGVMMPGMLNSCKEHEASAQLTVTGGSTRQTVYADDAEGSADVSFETAGGWSSTITEGAATRAEEGETRAVATWITISPSSGSKAGDYTIQISLDTNFTGADRTATITITSGGESIAIVVTQKAATESGEKPVETVAVTGVTLNKETTALTIGDNETLTATVAPANATDRTVTWKSSAETIATVDANGTITAVAPGTATITVTSAADATKTATCTVTVVAALDIFTKIPDAEFLAYCKAQTAWDTNGDGELSKTEVTAVKTIEVNSNSVSSLKGIEYFTGLIRLVASNNQLTSLDLSKNTALTQLFCYNNKLTLLDVSANTALTDLSCGDNNITSLDVSKNTALTELHCPNNKLTSLDVSKNAALERLICYRNEIVSLNVSKNTALTYLDCSENQLTSLDFSTSLTFLYCNSNKLTSLDMSKNTVMMELGCSGNMLKSLDISNNKSLIRLLCEFNPGDETIFPVTAWFDNNSIPAHFTNGSWTLGGKTITVDYTKAN
jgi:hypothetical protein